MNGYKILVFLLAIPLLLAALFGMTYISQFKKEREVRKRTTEIKQFFAKEYPELQAELNVAGFTSNLTSGIVPFATDASYSILFRKKINGKTVIELNFPFLVSSDRSITFINPFTLTLLQQQSVNTFDVLKEANYYGDYRIKALRKDLKYELMSIKSIKGVELKDYDEN